MQFKNSSFAFRRSFKFSHQFKSDEPFYILFYVLFAVVRFRISLQLTNINAKFEAATQ